MSTILTVSCDISPKYDTNYSETTVRVTALSKSIGIQQCCCTASDVLSAKNNYLCSTTCCPSTMDSSLGSWVLKGVSGCMQFSRLQFVHK